MLKRLLSVLILFSPLTAFSQSTESGWSLCTVDRFSPSDVDVLNQFCQSLGESFSHPPWTMLNEATLSKEGWEVYTILSDNTVGEGFRALASELKKRGVEGCDFFFTK